MPAIPPYREGDLIKLLRVPTWMEAALGENALRLIRGGVGATHRIAEIDEWGRPWLEFPGEDDSVHLFQVDDEDLEPIA